MFATHLDMLDGRAYARVVRGHSLICLALCHKTLHELQLTVEEGNRMKNYIENFHDNLLSYEYTESDEN